MEQKVQTNENQSQDNHNQTEKKENNFVVKICKKYKIFKKINCAKINSIGVSDYLLINPTKKKRKSLRIWKKKKKEIKTKFAENTKFNFHKFSTEMI